MSKRRKPTETKCIRCGRWVKRDTTRIVEDAGVNLPRGFKSVSIRRECKQCP